MTSDPGVPAGAHAPTFAVAPSAEPTTTHLAIPATAPVAAGPSTAEPTTAPIAAPPNTAEPTTAPIAAPPKTPEPTTAPIAAPPNTPEPTTTPIAAPPNTAEPATVEPVTEAIPSGPSPTLTTVLVPLAIGSAVVVVLGVYGRVHEPTGIAVSLAGFSGPLAAKAWLATGAFTLAFVQLFSALVIYGKVPRVRPSSWTGRLHRWSGRAAFLLAIPVAVHCLYALGFQTYSARAMIHSLMGCFFFGAFTVKMLILPKRRVPGWVLPLLGGLVFTGLVVLWLTSSLWFFTTAGVTL